MCFIVFSYKNHPEYKLIFCANRDEFHARDAEKMHFWHEYKHVLAGKDLKEGGTWLAATTNGKFAALTNFRESVSSAIGKPSRGEIIKKFLTENYSCENFITYLEQTKDIYDGYNLIFGSIDKLFYYSNRSNGLLPIAPGIYGLSNATLDTPWPKIVRGKKLFQNIISNKSFSVEDLMNMLSDNKKPDGDILPDTGIPKIYERELSPIFVDMGDYGTRSSTVILVDYDNNANVYEKTHDVAEDKSDFRHFTLEIQ